MKWTSYSLLVAALFLSCSPVTADEQEDFRRRLVSPWGFEDRLGVDSIGETLLNPKERDTLHYWMYEQEVLSGIASERDSQDLKMVAGYGVKFLGYGIGALDDQLPVRSIVAGGVLSVGTAILGNAAEDWGQHLIDSAEETAAMRIAIYLDKKVANVIKPNGVLDLKALRNIGDTKLATLWSDPDFIEEVGNLDIIAHMRDGVTMEMLSATLRDTGAIRTSVDKLDERLIQLNRGYKELRSLQLTAIDQLHVNGQALSRVETRVDETATVVAALAASNLPPSQILGLAQAGVLRIKAEDLLTFERAATAQRYKAEFDRAATVFSSLATAFNAAGLDPDLVSTTAKFGDLLTSGGAFAAAVTVGEPLSVFSTGASLFGSASSFFGKKKSDGSQKALAAIFRELQSLSNLIRQYHQQQMEALRLIALKLDNLEHILNRRFAELGLDVAMIQYDVRELLYEDVRVCERLVEEFALPDTQLLLSRGLLGFSIWFQADNRAVDYGRCLNGLMARQRVVSETDYSGMLRADAIEDPAEGDSASDRRDAVRRVEQRVLQPTIDYIREYSGLTDGEAVARKLTYPTPDICSALGVYGGELHHTCAGFSGPSWPSSRLHFSQFNVGQGALLSAPTAIMMSRFTRVIAPWNGVLVESDGQATSRVISEKEARSLSRKSLSRRTRHLRSLAAAADALDLNIAQAQVMAGAPILHRVAEILDKKILPAYARSRILQDPTEIDKLLAAPPPNHNLPGPICVTGNEAWDALCLMEANPTFAGNVIRALIARRLDRNGVTFEKWRSAIRSPFSTHALDMIGHDIILMDAAKGLDDRTFGVWAIELPRVYSDPFIQGSEGPSRATSCWSAAAVPTSYEENELVVADKFYTKPTSSRCVLLDTFVADNFTSLNFATNFHALLTERSLVVGLLNEMCGANSNYPSIYCAPFSQASSVAQRQVLTVAQ